VFERFKPLAQEEIDKLDLSALTLPEIKTLIDMTGYKAVDKLLAEAFCLKHMTVEQAAEYADVCVSTAKRHKPTVIKKLSDTLKKVVPFWENYLLF